MIVHGAVQEGTFRGTHDGSRHRPARLPDYVRVVEVRDGKQVSLNLTFDRFVMLEQRRQAPAADVRAWSILCDRNRVRTSALQRRRGAIHRFPGRSQKWIPWVRLDPVKPLPC